MLFRVKQTKHVTYPGHFLPLNHGEQFHGLQDTPFPVHNIDQTRELSEKYRKPKTQTHEIKS